MASRSAGSAILASFSSWVPVVRARQVFETIGSYVGYGVAHYADFYDLRHVLILGRVTSGEAGAIIIKNAQPWIDKP